MKYLLAPLLTILFLSLSGESFAQYGQEMQDEKVLKSPPLPEQYNDFEYEDFKDFDFDVKPKVEIYDPFEKVNRKIFVFNDKLDIYFLEPVATYYGKVVPGPIIRSVRNFFNNLSAPFSVANSLLQGDGNNAMASFSSFMINSTLGVVGLFDVAGNKKIEYDKEDLGQTFARYGSGPGPYLMLPFFGPSTLRDASGMAITESLSPLSLNITKIGNDDLVSDKAVLGMSVISVIDKRESLLTIIRDLRANSFDFYATSRSAYMQNRESKIKH